MNTHAPYDPDPSLVEDLLNQYDYSQRDLKTFLETHSENDYLQEFVRDMASERDYEYGVGRLIARYDAAVREADAAIDRLVDGLRARDVFEDTLVIVTSDHGESLLEHGIFLITTGYTISRSRSR